MGMLGEQFERTVSGHLEYLARVDSPGSDQKNLNHWPVRGFLRGLNALHLR